MTTATLEIPSTNAADWQVPEGQTRVLIPGNELDIGLTAHGNGNEYCSVELGMGADPVAFNEAVLTSERKRLGCKLRPDGTWRDSWRFRKEYLREAEAAAGQPVFEGEWLDWQAPHICEPVFCMDVDTSPAGITWALFAADPPEGFVVGKDGQRSPIARARDDRVSLSKAFWSLSEERRAHQLSQWLVPRAAGRVRCWVHPDSQPEGLPAGIVSVRRTFAGGNDVGEGVEASDTTMVVLCGDSREQAAEWALNTITPTDAGRLAVAVCRFYHGALACPVRKMHGLTMIRAMVDECGYGRLWRDQHVTTAAKVRTDQLGWPKGEASDEYLFGRMVDAIQYHRITIHSAELMRQLRQYIYDEMGRITLSTLADTPVELRRRHGDLAVALALAWRAASDLPRFVDVKVVDTAPKGSMNWRDEQDARKGKGDAWYRR